MWIYILRQKTKGSTKTHISYRDLGMPATGSMGQNNRKEQDRWQKEKTRRFL